MDDYNDLEQNTQNSQSGGENELQNRIPITYVVT